jgi:hypothetical protein
VNQYLFGFVISALYPLSHWLSQLCFGLRCDRLLRDWLVIAEWSGNRIKIGNIRTGAPVCKFGHLGEGEGEFKYPTGVAVTSDSSFVVVADWGNIRVQVLRLVDGADGASAWAWRLASKYFFAVFLDAQPDK